MRHVLTLWLLTWAQVLYGLALLLLVLGVAHHVLRCRHPDVLTELRRDDQGRVTKPVTVDYRCLHCLRRIGSTQPGHEGERS